MSYTVEIRDDSYSSNNSIGIDLIPHTFLVVTGPDGVEHSYGFAPEQTGLFGPGNVQDDTGHPYDANSGKFSISESQYTALMDYINRTDAVSPPYALPFGSQCTNWALAGLAEAGIIPSVLGPGMEPTNIFFDFVRTLIFNPIWQKIGFEIYDLFAVSRAQRQYDPLAIDLDGDGIETVGIAGGVLFDHDGDGIKTGTGWVKGDDAFVVLDRNGNGLIDAGAELFGVDYVKSSGQTAANGFDALADLDGNADGLFDATDAQYANVKIWRDINQDGISQADELQSLAAAGIAAIDLAAHTATQNLGNGNTQTLTAGVAGLEGDAVALDLADNPFYREFADHLDTTAVASLPDMQGAGRLRDLKEAATLSAALAAQLADLQTTYRTHQQFDAELDTLIRNWANTGEFDTSVEQAAALGYVLSYRTPDGTDVTAWLELLETFNGMAFVQVEAGGVRTGAGGWRAVAAGGSGLVLTLSAAQMTSLEQSYAALKQSVCDGLVLQTRLKGYMDAIDLQIDANGISLDFSGVETMLADKHASDAREEQETRRWRGGDYASRTTANDGQWSKAA